MRRLSIQGYVFPLMLPAAPHPPAPLPVLISLLSLFPHSRAQHTAYLLTCLRGHGKQWHKQLLTKYQGEKRLPCVCVWACASMNICREMHVKWDVSMELWVAKGNTWSQLFLLRLCLQLSFNAKLLSPPQGSMCLLLRSPFQIILSVSDTCMLTPLTSWYIPAE